MKPNLLLHICCAPCSTHVVEILRENYNVSGYFHNPNIHPQDEYIKRETEMKRYAKMIDLEIVFAEYNDDEWFQITKGMEDLPEGDKRCLVCYKMRLENTARYASQHNYEYITTTLSISPHKNADVINKIGIEVANQYGLKWYSGDFKKQGGFDKSIRMSKEAGLYRQSYCGCIFSKVEAENRKRNIIRR